MKKKLEYPVFAFEKRNNMIYVFFKERKLKSTNTDIFKTLKFKNIIHVDSTGSKYQIETAYKVRYLGLWGFNPLLKGRQILIDFDYSSNVERISLVDFKKDIIERIEKTRQLWKSGWNVNELKNAVNNSSSFEEIAHLLK